MKKKINKVTKNQLLHLVLEEHATIKGAASNVGINYSSAKSIINSFKKKRGGLHAPEQQKTLCPCDLKQAEIVSRTDGPAIQILARMEGAQFSSTKQAGYRIL